jgi:hypothetical protein
LRFLFWIATKDREKARERKRERERKRAPFQNIEDDSEFRWKLQEIKMFILEGTNLTS